jgi:hypothetical protein
MRTGSVWFFQRALTDWYKANIRKKSKNKKIKVISTSVRRYIVKQSLAVLFSASLLAFLSGYMLASGSFSKLYCPGDRGHHIPLYYSGGSNPGEPDNRQIVHVDPVFSNNHQIDPYVPGDIKEVVKNNRLAECAENGMILARRDVNNIGTHCTDYYSSSTSTSWRLRSTSRSPGSVERIFKVEGGNPILWVTFISGQPQYVSSEAQRHLPSRGRNHLQDQQVTKEHLASPIPDTIRDMGGTGVIRGVIGG